MSDVYLPVLKDTKDPHYRYKMPKLTAKIEGSGNGIKTVITNMQAIARALDRPPSYPTKYFGCELGAQVTITNDQFVVNGSHDPDKLLNLLYGFIKKFVLCQKCHNPETSLTIVNKNIKQKCIACGYETVIPKTLHKLTTYIMAHPPDTSLATAAAAAAAAKAAKGEKSKSSKSKTKNESPSGKGKGHNGHSSRQADEFDTNNNTKEEEEVEDEFDDEEFSTTAYAQRIRDLTDGLGNGVYVGDAKENANMFYQIVKEKKETGALLEASVQRELLKQAETLSIRDKSTLILSELLFTENILQEIKQHKMLLLRFCHQNRKAQKYLLGGFEKLVGDVFKDTLFDKSMSIMKCFYDEDILEEEAIIEWSQKESKKYVGKEMSRKIHEKVAPFIKWLKEAESESEDEDDDEDEDEDEENESRNGGEELGSNGDDDSQNLETDDSGSDGKQSPGNGKLNNNNNNNNNNKSKANGKPQPQQQNGTLRRREEEEEDEEEEVEFSHRVSGLTIKEVSVGGQQQQQKQVAANNHEEENDDDLDIDNI